ncbi:Nucleotidyl transferase of unknown function [Ekhidna lutea]|uniref:DUF6036 domain-containing protein n=1 Tax=Ekhidna lutea TaxID=447679 RepID=A0A239IQ72_EKHLU|nr:nucleotidyltransferase [Ekhidna lutea]SNS95707.1 Nucleotidyl transferase of unknown function [Ekhidna lutea]
MNLYEESCRLFTKYQVRFVIIGGFAVNFWGYNRSTGDLDFLIDHETDNLEKLYLALDKLGFLIDNEAKGEISKGELIQFSNSHHVIELLFKINIDKEFELIHRDSKYSKFGDVEVPFIDFDDLILEKVKSKRPKDLNDVYELKRINNRL